MRWTVLIALGACTTTFAVPSETNVMPPTIPADVFATLKDATGAHAELCDHDPADTTFPANADRITNRFCQPTLPTPHGFRDLLATLNMDFGAGHDPAFALLAHSSALTARKVSSITPTAFVFTPLGADGKPPRDYTFVAFDPGEPFVEVASFSPADMAVNFYIVLFDKDCTATGCGPNDLLTENQLVGWSNIRIYESTTALGNTIADCRQCHIGTGKDDPMTGDPLILRMQEIEAPHTHWMSAQTAGGKALLADFQAAHGTHEDYGGIPAALLDHSDPDQMAAFIQAAGFGNQPNAFPSAQIESDIVKMAPAQPANNVPIGWSAAWQTIYDAAEAGRFIPAPYHDVKVTDPDKLEAMTAKYQAHLAGAALDTDIRDVFLDTRLVDMGFASPANADGHTLLVQQCQQCHHSRLDPTITRDKFLVDKLDQMTREEKDLAIARIQMPTTTRLTMPPPLFRSVTDEQRQRMIAELQK
ncbi:MAG: hypothetical protein JO257_37320 [Deltaproteobacteria bacterium]|nr:hypothetical protein [Deltaproteobacteria bacterium]